MKNNLVKKIISFTFLLISILSLSSCSEEGVCVVKFYNDRTIVAVEKIAPYSNVEYTGEEPLKAGYKFIGWDKELINVTTDLHVHALFKRNKELPSKVTDIIGEYVQPKIFFRTFNSLSAEEAKNELGIYYIENETDLENIDYDKEIVLYEETVRSLQNLIEKIELITKFEEVSIEALGNDLNNVFSSISKSKLAVEILTSMDIGEGILNSILSPSEELTYQTRKTIFEKDLQNMAKISSSIAKILANSHEYSLTETVKTEIASIDEVLKNLEMLSYFGDENVKFIIDAAIDFISDESFTEVIFAITKWAEKNGIDSFDTLYNKYLLNSEIVNLNALAPLELLTTILDTANNSGLIEKVLGFISIEIDSDLITSIIENVKDFNSLMHETSLKNYTLEELSTLTIDDLLKVLYLNKDEKLFAALEKVYLVANTIYEFINEEVLPIAKGDFDLILDVVKNLLLKGYFASYDHETGTLNNAILESEVDNIFKISYLQDEEVLKLIATFMDYELAEDANILEVVKTAEFKIAFVEFAGNMVNFIYGGMKDMTLLEIVSDIIESLV